MKTTRNIADRKVKSFTLVEISITLLLSLIVVAMLYIALNIVIRQVEQPEATASENITLLNSAISNAFYNASAITYAEGSQIISCKDSAQTRLFFFEPEDIIMQLENPYAIDTLWEGEYNFSLVTNEYKLVDNLNFYFPLQGDTIHLFITKEYSLATLLNHKEISFEY